MKNYTSLTGGKIVIFCLVLMSFSLVKSQTPLKGTYTIGSGRTFTTINDAVTSLKTNGVNGAVVFNISDGIYLEQIKIPSITGVSSTNTITFQSASAINTSVTISYAVKTTPVDSNFVVLLENANYIIFKNLTFKNGNSEYGHVIRVKGTTTFLTFNGNIFSGTTAKASDEANCSDLFYDGGGDSRSTITNNTFQYGAYGLSYNAGPVESNLGAPTVSNNKFDEQILGFMSLSNAYNSTISGNICTSQSGNFVKGVSLNSLTSLYTTFVKNKINIINPTNNSYGLYLSNITKLWMANNSISVGGSGVSHAVYMVATTVNMDYNSVHSYNTNTASTTLYVDKNSSDMIITDLTDNILSNMGGGSLAVIKYGTVIKISDYNDFYTLGPLAHWYSSATNYDVISDLTGWQTKTTKDVHSISISPTFVSNTDLHILNPGIDDKGYPPSTASYTVDIDGDIRSTTTPDIGSDEATLLTWDIGISKIRSFDGGFSPIKVLLTNFGTGTLTSAGISWTLDGVTQTKYNWTGSLKTNDSTEVTLGSVNISWSASHTIKASTSLPNGKTDKVISNDAKTYTQVVSALTDISITKIRSISGGSSPVKILLANYGSGNVTQAKVDWEFDNIAQTTFNWTGLLKPNDSIEVSIGSVSVGLINPHTIKAWSSMPNGIADAKSSNDTITSTKIACMNGVYTIGANSDFATIKEAVNILTISGVNGAVILNIKDGTYNEQIGIPFISGASAINTITFQSAAAVNTAVVISYAVKTMPVDSNFVVQLENTHYLTFRNLTFKNDNPAYGHVIKVKGQTSYLNYLNNIFIGTTVADPSTYYADVFYDGRDIQSIFQNNIFQSGACGLYYSDVSQLEGFSNVTVVNNKFTDQLNFFMMLRAGIDTVTNNIFTGQSASVSFGNCGFGTIFSGNIINMPNPTDFVSAITFGGSQSIKMFNNSITMGGTSPVRAISIFSSHYLKVYFNTIHLTNTNSASTCIYIYRDNGYGLELKNNIFSNIGGGSLITKLYGSFSILESDYNNFYTLGAFAVLGTSTDLSERYNNYLYNLASWKTNSSLDAHSLSVLPGFVSDTNLHTFNADLNDKGTPVSNITNDIDGDTRNTETPDIGSDEFEPKGLDIAITGFRNIQTDLSPIKVLLTNFGTDNITQTNIDWLFDNVPQSKFIWTGLLKPKDTIEVSIGSVDVGKINSHTFKVWTSLPNGVVDPRPDNDTIISTQMVPMHGVYTIGGTQPSYTTFTKAINDMIARGIYDSVVFNVRKGVYNEEITIPNIIGASRFNSITIQSETQNYNDVQISPVTLNNAVGVTFRYLTINAPSGKPCVNLTAGSYISFYRNLFTGEIGDGSYGGSLISTSETGNSIFDGNIFKNGASGIRAYFSQYNTGVVYQIINNQFINQLNEALVLGAMSSVIIKSNIIKTNQPNSYYYGIFINTCNDLLIEKNDISTFLGGYGIYIREITNLTSTPKQISNNFIRINEGNETGVGIYLETAHNLNIYNNNISILSKSNTSSGITIDNGEGVRIFNNIVACFVEAYTLYLSDLGIIESCDYNDFYTVSPNLIYTDNTIFNNMASWAAVSGFDKHSLSVNPGFLGRDNLHISNLNLNRAGKSLTEIKDDIDGEVRDPLLPDIGADEIFPSVPDVDMKLDLASPNFPINENSQVSVSMRNYGLLPLTSVWLHWKFNRFVQDSVYWSGNLAPGDSITVFLGSQKFERLVNNTIMVWTSHPNGIKDDTKFNKLIVIDNLYAAFAGEYSIGYNIGADFNTFADALDVLNLAGVSGKTIFNVGKGTYNERLLLYDVRGVNKDKTITFTGDSTKISYTILTIVGTYTDNHVIDFYGADYITFRNLTITNTSPNYGRIVLFEKNANHISFENNIIHAEATSSYPLVFSKNSINNYSKFANNRFENGNYAIDFRGQNDTGTVISNNQFLNQIVGGLNLHLQDSLSIMANEFSNNNLNVSYNAITCDTCKNLKIIKNKVNLMYGGNAFNLEGCKAETSGRTLIANNFVAIKTNGTLTTQGIKLLQCNNADVFYNNLNVIGNGSAKTAFSIDQAQNISLFNNIFVNTSGGQLFDIKATSTLQSDHNDLYCTGSKFADFNGKSISSVSEWQVNTGLDATSYTFDPYYLSESDLHVSQPALNNKGKVLAGITTDIDNETRSITNPDIGADEFVYVTTDIGVSEIINKSGCRFKDNDTIKIKINNYGSDAQSDFSIGYILNNKDTVIEKSGSLVINAGQQILYAFKKSTDLSRVGPYVIKAFVNLTGDSKLTNDTTIADIYNSSVFDLQLTASDTDICRGESVIITTSGGATYLWNNGSTNQKITDKPLETITYSVTATNMYGCSVSDSVLIKVNLNPSIPYVYKTITGKTFCYNDSVILSSNYHTNLVWSTGAITRTIVVKKSGTYNVIYTDENNCHSQSDDLDLARELLPFITSNNESLMICNGTTVGLTINYAQNFEWSTGSKKSTISVTPTVTSTYWVSGISSYGCAYKDSITIQIANSSVIPEAVSIMYPADSSKTVTLPAELSWKSSQGAEFYRITVWPAQDSISGKTIVRDFSGLNLSLTKNDLEYGKSYKWRVDASSGCIFTAGKVQTFTTRKLPDLIISSIQTPISVYSDQETEVTMEIKNIGGGGTLNQTWSDKVYLSGDSIYDYGWDFDMGTNNSVAYLDSGQSYLSTKKITIPTNTSGNYYVFGQTDIPGYNLPKGNVTEENEANNLTRGKDPIWVKLKPPPDLQVTAISSIPTMVSEQTYPVTYTVKNKGKSAAIGNSPGQRGIWWDMICLSKDANAGASYFLSPMMHIGSLEVDSEYTQKFYVTIPVGMHGKYFFVVTTDYGNAVKENVYSANNTTQSDSVNIILYPPADLTATNLIYPDTVNNVDPFRIEWTDLNIGATTSRRASPYWDDNIILVPVQDRNFDNAIKFTYHWINSDSLKENFTNLAFKDITLDKAVTPGAYYVYIDVNYSSYTFEYNKTNNLIKGPKVLQITKAECPDLKVKEISMVDTITIDGVYPLSYNVRNEGNVITRDNKWVDAIGFSAQKYVLGSFSNPLFSFDITNPLESDSSYTKKMSFKLEGSELPDLKSDNYYLWVYTNKNRDAYECKDTNNIFNKRIFLKTGDLANVNISCPDSAFSGSSVNIKWTVKNTGNVTMSSKKWYDMVILGEKSVYSQVNKKRLLAGESYDCEFQLKVPGNYSGWYKFQFRCDTYNQCNEKHRENNINWDSIYVRYVKPSDLVVNDIQCPSQIIAGQPFTITWTVTNQGNSATSVKEWTDYVVLSGNYTLDESDYALVSASHQGILAPGESYTKEVEVVLPVNMANIYVLIVKTDLSDKSDKNDKGLVYEGENEFNNFRCKEIEVNPQTLSDLIVTKIVNPNKVTVGDNLEIIWTIQNVGGDSAVGYMKDMIYLSKDTIWDNDDQVIGESYKHIKMKATDLLTDTISCQLKNAAIGDYYILVKTDNHNNIYETRDWNNTGVSKSTLHVDVTELMLNLQVKTTLTDNWPLYYYISIPDSLKEETIIVSLRGDTVNTSNELYARHLDVPSQSNYDYGYQFPFAGNQELIIPSAKIGNCYLMVYGNSASVKPQNISLYAKKLNFEIRKIKATQGGNNGSTTVQIDGAKFDATMVIALVNGTDSIKAGKIYFTDASKVFATFNLKGKKIGMYNVYARNSKGNTTLLKNGFEIIAGTKPGVYISISVESINKTAGIIKVQYINTGNVDVYNIHSVIKSINTISAYPPIAFTVQGLNDGLRELYFDDFKETNGPQDVLRPGAIGEKILFVETPSKVWVVIAAEEAEFKY